ncbi:hypothetical protein GW17_00044463 [Ensete ventricosum]|nr:hypothetical protein GW17_00044463 [Ensete ventricosum]
MEKSTIGSRLKKKKGKEEEEKKKEEEYLAVVLVCELPAARPRRLRVDRELSPPSRRKFTACGLPGMYQSRRYNKPWMLSTLPKS